jgi:ABC-type branched-subunit amino acid transport system substrate-binding protein
VNYYRSDHVSPRPWRERAGRLAGKVRVLACVLAPVAAACGRRDVLVAIPGHQDVTRVAREAMPDDGRGPRVRFVEDIARLPSGRFGDIRYAERLTAMREVVAIVGPMDSRTALVTAPYYNNAGITQLLPTATSRDLHRAGAHTLMLAPDDSLEGAFIARFVAADLGARTASVFFVNDEYGNGLGRAVAAALRARGVRVLDQVFYGPDACPTNGVRDDFAQLLPASFRRGVPEVIVVAGRDLDAGCLVRRTFALHPRTKVVLGDGVEMRPYFREAAGAAASDSAYAVAFWNPASGDSLSRDFVRRFRRIVGRDPTPGDAMVYDAIRLAVAAAKAEGADRQAVHGHLMALGTRLPALPGVTGDLAPAGSGPRRLLMLRWAGGSPREVSAW